jgi:hypothetical protein
MALEQEAFKVCAVVYVHHCYVDDDLASVWTLPGVYDAESDDAPGIDEYSQHPRAVLFADNLHGPIAGKFADAALRLLECVGLSAKPATLVDD